MPDETQANQTDPQENTQDPGKDGQGPETVNDEDGKQAEPSQPPQMFSDEQLNFLRSDFGRLIKRQLEESVLPLLRTNQQQGYVPPHGGQSEAVQKFNETLQQKIFDGDVMGAFDMYYNVKQKAQENLSKQQKTELERELSSFASQPYYKEVFASMNKIAQDSINDGYPVKAAAQSAYHAAVARHLMSKAQLGGGDPASLSMLSSGKRQAPVTKPRLPDHLKAAFERDKADGIFKTEAEYIAKLSPQIRRQYNL